uniref:Uncharacterized protein n=1 Tax=uncultured bacterium A1Q1_fos_1000 TaxID=1256536 RepID=L7VVT5_9BACT|nr:hypothetical protein [uncultured bacterium A1Q1_fos_1000]
MWVLVDGVGRLDLAASGPCFVEADQGDRLAGWLLGHHVLLREVGITPIGHQREATQQGASIPEVNVGRVLLCERANVVTLEEQDT